MNGLALEGVLFRIYWYLVGVIKPNWPPAKVHHDGQTKDFDMVRR